MAEESSWSARYILGLKPWSPRLSGFPLLEGYCQVRLATLDAAFTPRRLTSGDVAEERYSTGNKCLKVKKVRKVSNELCVLALWFNGWVGQSDLASLVSRFRNTCSSVSNCLGFSFQNHRTSIESRLGRVFYEVVHALQESIDPGQSRRLGRDSEAERGLEGLLITVGPRHGQQPPITMSSLLDKVERVM